MPGSGAGTMNDIYFYGGDTTANSGGSCPPIGDSNNSPGKIHPAGGMNLYNAILDENGRLTDYHAYVQIKPQNNAEPAYTVGTAFDDRFGTVTTSVPMARPGETITFTAEPSPGCYLVSLTVTDHNGETIALNNGGFEFTMPSSSVTVNANFHSINYDIIVTPSEYGTITVPETAEKGSTVKLTVDPEQGYSFKSLTITDSQGQSLPFSGDASDGFTFPMPEDDVTVTVEFEAMNRTLIASLSGSEYGSYTVSVNGGDPVLLSSNGTVSIDGVKTGDWITVTFSPAADGRINVFYLEDSLAFVEHHESDILNYSYTFSMPGEKTIIHTGFAYYISAEQVNYVDEHGEVNTVTATVLSGYEPRDVYDNAMRVILGQENAVSWYVVKDDITYTSAEDYLYKTFLFLKGNVNLIIADGKTLTVQDRISDGSLSVYGQTNGTGKIVADTVQTTTNVCSAELSVGSFNSSASDIYVKNGKLTVSWDVKCNTMEITSGVTSVTGTVNWQSSLVLGCADRDDSIKIGTYYNEYGDYPQIANGQTLSDGENEYTGTLNDTQFAALAGKTLKKAHTHNLTDEHLTLRQASDPTYNSAEGTYTDGNVEYYTCSLCVNRFIEENGELKRATDEDIIVPYFRFRTTVVAGYTLCEVIGYNGTDAVVFIPDEVPNSYYDETQRGKPVRA